MESKIKEIQPMVAESWVRYDPNLLEGPLVRPVAKTEADAQVKSRNEGSSGSGGQGAETGNDSELVAEIKQFLEDFKIGLNFQIHEKTGDLVVQVFNQESGEVIRQIPPEDLVKLHEKLVELRGVLFEEKV